MAWIWIRFPQVSSNTAVVTGPMAVGGWVKTTPSPVSRSYSARTSATAKAVNGIPSATSASRNGPTAGWFAGSSTNSTPSRASGETTVSQETSPIGTSVFFSNPSFVV